MSSLLLNEGQIIGIKNTLCDDYKLFESTKRVIWGTACEQQHKSVPILYLMVITTKHRKNAKKRGFWQLSILMIILLLYVVYLSNETAGFYQTFKGFCCRKLRPDRLSAQSSKLKGDPPFKSSDYANKDVKFLYCSNSIAM